jgi:hypothetical protein
VNHHDDQANDKPRLTWAYAPAVMALVFMALIARFLPSSPSSPPNQPDLSPTQRQRVVIFLVDTTDYFDAHGDFVRSVISRHCPRCEIRPVNLHGDLSVPSIMSALQHVHELSQTFASSTTILVNLSLGTYTFDPNLHAIARALTAQGVVLIASAGNDNKATPFYPAAFDEVLGVCSSTRYRKRKTSYSNFGDWVSLCAPGLQYVTRPLQTGRLASGTSFSSPVVTGILGHLLLQSPCASPPAGRRALVRTADPVDLKRYKLGAGLVNATAAKYYLRHLYPCQSDSTFLQRQVARLERLATKAGVSLAVIVYFFASIFTLPFLLAFTIDRLQRRAAKRLQQRILHAYTGSAHYRRQRVLAIRQEVIRRQRVPHRRQAELLVLLHALYQFGESCWWCEKAAAESTQHDIDHLDPSACQRCGLEPLAALPDSGENS